MGTFWSKHNAHTLLSSLSNTLYIYIIQQTKQVTMLVTIFERSEESEAYQKTIFTIIKMKLMGSDNILNLHSSVKLFLFKVELIGFGKRHNVFWPPTLVGKNSEVLLFSSFFLVFCRLPLLC